MREDTREKIKEYKVYTFAYVKQIEGAEKQLRVGEKVLYVSPTAVDITDVNTKKVKHDNGVIMLTHERVLFYFKVLSHESFESIKLSEIRSIDSELTKVCAHINIHTIVKSYNFSITCRAEIAIKIKEIFMETKNLAESSPDYNSSEISSADEIRKIKGLLDDGIISQEEFEAKKKQLLGL